MKYFKTIMGILLAILFLDSPLFVQYYDIKYGNLIYIILPIFYIVVLYIALHALNLRRVNPRLFKLELNSRVALAFVSLSVVIMAMKFDLQSFLIGDIDLVRSDYLYKEIDFSDQIAPLLLVYPFIYICYFFATKDRKYTLIPVLIILGMIFCGLTSGGRASNFNLFILYLLIGKPKFISRKNLFFISPKNIIYFSLFIALFSFITLGRYHTTEFNNKAALLESGVPIIFNDYLKDRSSNAELKDLTIELVFYFGQGVPAFCNKIENLEITPLPRSLWGLQPFIERQLIRLGFLSHSQMQRYDEMTDLSIGSGFFKSSWSTGFLDIYFHEGVLFSILFFTFVAYILFVCEQNLKKANSPKYNILTGFNLMFVLTIFLNPAFEETVVFFSYVIIFLSDVKTTT